MDNQEYKEPMYPELTLNMKRISYLDDRGQIVTRSHQAIEEVLIDLSLTWQGEVIQGFLKDRVQNAIPTYLFMHKHLEELVSVYQENQELRAFLEKVYFNFNLRTSFFENKRQILLEELGHALVPINVHEVSSLIHETIRTRYPSRLEIREMLDKSHWLFVIALLQLVRPVVIGLFMYNQQQLMQSMLLSQGK